MVRPEEMRIRSGVRPTQQDIFIMIGATGRYELSFENLYELLRTYINWFGMSKNTKKGQFNLNYPLKM
jgi:hypothetical protein